MPEAALVSVITPVSNGEHYIRAALESVLAQTYRPVEILVIDDGSTDRSAAVLEAYSPHVQYHYQPNAGLSVARNRGVRLATSDFLAFLDADDLWMAEKLDLQMRALTRDSELEAVFGHMRQFYSPDVTDEARTAVRYSQEIVANTDGAWEWSTPKPELHQVSADYYFLQRSVLRYQLAVASSMRILTCCRRHGLMEGERKISQSRTQVLFHFAGVSSWPTGSIFRERGGALPSVSSTTHFELSLAA